MDGHRRMSAGAGTAEGDAAVEVVAGEIAPGWALAEWLMSLTDLSPASTRAYENGVRSFITWAERAGADGPEKVTRLVLRRYLAYMTTRHYARQTVAQRASALRRYFGWLGRKGTIAGDPTAGLSARTGGSRLPRPLSRSELEVILDDPPARRARSANEVRLRDDAALELLYGSGLRVSELCGLSSGGPRPTRAVGPRSGERAPSSEGCPSPRAPPVPYESGSTRAGRHWPGRSRLRKLFSSTPGGIA